MSKLLIVNNKYRNLKIVNWNFEPRRWRTHPSPYPTIGRPCWQFIMHFKNELFGNLRTIILLQKTKKKNCRFIFRPYHVNNYNL